MMNRSRLALFLLVAASARPALADDRPPNVVLMISDEKLKGVADALGVK